MTENRASTCEGGPQVPAATGKWVCGDPSLHAQAVKPWDLLTSSLSRGHFRHGMRYLSASAFSVYAERFACQVRLRGQSPLDLIALAVPIRVPPHTLCWKHRWSTEQMLAITGDALDVLLDSGHEQLVVLVDRLPTRRELWEERA